MSFLAFWFETAKRLDNPKTFSSQHIDEYHDLAYKVSGYTLPQLENLYEETLKENSDDGVPPFVTAVNFFVLWRIIYDVPEQLPCKDMAYTNVHSSRPTTCSVSSTGNDEDADWPVNFDVTGKKTVGIEAFEWVELSGYNGLHDLKYLDANFPKRTLDP